MKKLFLAPLMVLSLLGVLFAAASPTTDDIVSHIDSVSLMVQTPGGSGSGVAVLNGDIAFVWTDAHVVEDTKWVRTVIDPVTGQPVVRCTFADVTLRRILFEDGRKVGEESRLAKVLRYSERQDIALLYIYSKGWVKRGTVFISDEETPKPGVALWHVGSMMGDRGFNSVSDGVFSTAGRLRKSFLPEDTAYPVVYDQISLNAAHPGSSGGGVFRKSDGKCVGLVTEYIGPGKTFGAMCITPARRIREFARKAQCQWALGEELVPAADRVHPMQDDIELPREWRAPASKTVPVFPLPVPETIPLPIPGK